MAHGKETPRQKMIGMMYLVLTALLALNVSTDVLDAFKIIDEGLQKTGNTIETKNDEIYSEFREAMLLNESKTAVWNNKAIEVKSRADSLNAYIQRLKIKVLSEAERGNIEGIVVDGEIIQDNIKATTDYDTPNRIMIGNELTDRSEARLLKNRIEEFREFLLNIEGSEEDLPEQLREAIKSSLNTEAPGQEGTLQNREKSVWEIHKFGHSPLMGFLAIMSSMQIDLRNAESEMINYLYAQISAGEVKFNELEAVVIPNSNYIIRGNPYQAEIFLAARDTTQAPSIYIVEGVSQPWEETVNAETGQIEYNMREGLNYQQIEVDLRTGKGIFERSGSSVGVKQWGGILEFQGPGGAIRRPFYEEYQVAEGSVVVSPTKMNVFYLGVDNPVEISVPGVPANQVQASASNGTIKRSGSSWIMNPMRQGNCIVTVSAQLNGSWAQVGSKPFRVKTVPDPIAMVANQRSGIISKSVLLAQPGVVAAMPEDFEFDLTFRVTEYTVVAIVGGFVNDVKVSGNQFNQEVRNLINGLSRGASVYIEEIRAVGPDGGVRPLSPISLKLN
ncbi:MAG: gliding motility protein GldM [Bacteroidales bacterium]|nr:gliding motility protein GldM [Bacteroidales bacterium]